MPEEGGGEGGEGGRERGRVGDNGTIMCALTCTYIRKQIVYKL